MALNHPSPQTPDKPKEDQVVLQMESGNTDPKTTDSNRLKEEAPKEEKHSMPALEVQSSKPNIPKPIMANPTSNPYAKPPINPNSTRNPNENQRLKSLLNSKTLTSVALSRPKSRLTDYSPQAPTKAMENSGFDPGSSRRSEVGGDEEEDTFKDEDLPGKYKEKKCKPGWRVLVEWVSFVTIMTCLITSLTIKPLKRESLWGLKIWKWCVMMMVIFCGRLFSGWLISLLVFSIERNFMLRIRLLYFVYGLRKSVQNIVWLGIVLLAWSLVFDSKVDMDRRSHRLLVFVSKALIAGSIAAITWLIKILLVKLLASGFHVNTFFERIKISLYYHHVLESLAGPPLDEVSGRQDRGNPRASFRRVVMEEMKRKKRSDSENTFKVDAERLKRLKKGNVSAWSMKRMVNSVITTGRLGSVSNAVDEMMREFSKSEEEARSEKEAKAEAQRIFENVAKPGEKYIEMEDLLKFLEKDDVCIIFPLFEGAEESGKIKQSAFRNWVVKGHMERKALANSLTDAKTAVHQLHKLASCVVVVIIIIEFLLVMGVATSKVILFVSSQLLVVGFMFNNTCKTIFEAIIFVFVMHPFDVGDRCVIDGVQMIVEEMNILSTVFLRFDNEKIYYPNSVLLTKPISNFYRSPNMSDTVEFAIDVHTPLEKINILKDQIHNYIQSKPKHWQSKHTVAVTAIENVNKMNMAVYLTHTMNYQNYIDKISRKSDLYLELKRIFEKHEIIYNLLPQEVCLNQHPSSITLVESNG
ncbi:mechanosensitive ion channel protein 10 [Amborella trichopoda]|nr:mechanosensitive ion channel protein 10 [Amborella trichopoda]|eukprot:XP_006854192.2 mechanosensitive ion channel protein 10 [Amborella trichopoda]